ncbi:Chemotaxis regulator - transmits chemoreceptor signals to flagelllar motor components CheY [Paramagnetospirillum magnetotacticum MS-1]|uniref:Chemotaxis regulator-transmits chemoreceptor signals to flagelllar motor components CheY n=1 Tax=Paramagnetospirillum magnetotacticum MS-1 TaxID=272627 RepID=A0A0C2V6E4_PARME|nr:response regulator [Paramagnetospirillum magnetotacticum]KIM00612.1 Chemotaxis regulator - transmits chemoreceptor signals to flagelllar motor components CheY [Paramagnetospirillum magnetotacticum MS-1]
MFPDFTPSRNLTDFSVLLVEDNGPSRLLIAGLLKSLGFSNITVADGGEAAVELLAASGCAPDIILCDWQMPVVDGLDLLSIVREGFKESIFIMVTATNSIEAAMLAKAHGVDGYLLKPVTKTNLHKAISETVNRVRSLHE